MAILPDIINRLWPSRLEQRAATVQIDSHQDWMQYISIPGMGKIAVVTEETAAQINAVFACIDIIVRTKTLIRPQIVRYDLEGKVVDSEHDQNYLLNIEANPYTSAIEWEEAFITNYLLFGKAYSKIVRNGRTGRPKEYINLISNQVVEKWVGSEVVYEYRNPEVGEAEIIKQRDMITISGFSLDNKKKYSRTALNKTALEDYVSMTNYGREMYQNGTHMMGLLISEGPMTNEALELLRSSIEKKYSAKSGQLGALPKGVKFQELKYSLPMTDSNLIEAKKLSIEDIARGFGVPLTLIFRGESADNKGDNEFNIFLTTTIAPLCMKMEVQLKRKIFRSSENTHYVKYDYNGLVRTDYKTKMEGLQKAIDAGFMCPDEARHVVGLSPMPDGLGKIFRYPMNYVAAQNFLDYLPNKKDNGTN